MQCNFALIEHYPVTGNRYFIGYYRSIAEAHMMQNYMTYTNTMDSVYKVVPAVDADFLAIPTHARLPKKEATDTEIE